MQIEISKPSGQRIMPETPYTLFPALYDYTRIGISQSALVIDDRFYLPFRAFWKGFIIHRTKKETGSHKSWFLLKFYCKITMAWLIKNNDIVSERVIKILNVTILNMPIFFVEKMWEAFALQKLLSFFQQKLSVSLVIKSWNTSRVDLLTSSLS